MPKEPTNTVAPLDTTALIITARERVAAYITARQKEDDDRKAALDAAATSRENARRVADAVVTAVTEAGVPASCADDGELVISVDGTEVCDVCPSTADGLLACGYRGEDTEPGQDVSEYTAEDAVAVLVDRCLSAYTEITGTVPGQPQRPQANPV